MIERRDATTGKGRGLDAGDRALLRDTADVAIFRNMVVVIRDRLLDMKKQGLTLQQIKAAKPTLDFDGIYGAPDRFIEAVYQTLGGTK